jgi:glycosyltransferase involved in cell wall biosynthesis
MNSKRVLIVTYYFPPRAGVASIRLKGLAKYLPHFGWEVVVLTARLPGEPDRRFKVVQTHYPGDVSAIFKERLGLQPDKGFQEQIGIPLEIREGKSSFTKKVVIKLKGIFAYPDEQKYWYKYAVEEGKKLLRKRRFDALVSSSGPVTAHLIAKALRKEHDLVWVADMRDLWTQGHHYPYGFIRKLFERRLEVKTLSFADALVTVSSPLAEKLKALHKVKPVFVVTNGFDPDEIWEVPLTEKFTITYTGQIYEGKQDPELLFKALKELIDEKVLDSKDVEVRFFGPKKLWLQQSIGKFNLEGVVKQFGVVSREVALQKQRESHVLLLLNWLDTREAGIYTGKIFEYLAAQRPILAVGGGENMLSELLERTKAGTHAPDIFALKRKLLEFYKEYKRKGNVSYMGIKDEIRKYSHYEMAKKFSQIFEQLMGR